jgi:hypothetical protein
MVLEGRKRNSTFAPRCAARLPHSPKFEATYICLPRVRITLNRMRLPGNCGLLTEVVQRHRPLSLAPAIEVHSLNYLPEVLIAAMYITCLRCKMR